MTNPTLVIHGGAGNADPAVIGREAYEGGLQGLRDALGAGSAVLGDGGTAMEAVLVAVQTMEDCPWLNAGTGGVLAEDWRVRCDASVMCGASGEAGAVGELERIRNPVRVADLVRRESTHTLIVGEEAQEIAILRGGMEQLDDDALVTPFREQQRRQLQERGGGPQLDHEGGGTVGAVALDTAGHLAAATSTGGMTGKSVGRVGDSAVPGAGTWAEGGVVALSCTGTGDVFLACATARAIAARMAFGGESLQAACLAELGRVTRQQGRGGVIGVDAAGNIALPFTTSGMYRGYWRDGQGHVGFGKEELDRVI